MLDDPDDLAILEGVIGLTAFRLETVAEVESIEHGAMLLQLGREQAQGFVIARPMPGDELAGCAADWSPPPAWTQQQSIDRDHLLILSAAVNHRAWVNDVEAYLAGQRAVPPQLDDEKCHFGRWLHAMAENGDAGELPHSHIDQLHSRIHVLASELCHQAEQGDRDVALARLPELHKLRDTLVGYIDELLNGHSRFSA